MFGVIWSVPSLAILIEKKIIQIDYEFQFDVPIKIYQLFDDGKDQTNLH